MILSFLSTLKPVHARKYGRSILEIHIWCFFIIQVSVLLAFMIPIYSLVSVGGNSFFSSQNGMGSENANLLTKPVRFCYVVGYCKSHAF